jgi:hypothetical protein
LNKKKESYGSKIPTDQFFKQNQKKNRLLPSYYNSTHKEFSGMGRLRRGHSLEVIFEEETTQFQPSIARLEEEEYINAIFSQKILSGGCIFSSASAPEEKGGHTQKSRIPLHTNRTSYLFLFRLWTIESLGTLILSFFCFLVHHHSHGIFPLVCYAIH